MLRNTWLNSVSMINGCSMLSTIIRGSHSRRSARPVSTCTWVSTPLPAGRTRAALGFVATAVMVGLRSG